MLHISPHPLAIVNHGLTTDRAVRNQMRADACGELAEQLTALGYIVAFPVRRGYGETGGAFLEGETRSCRDADFVGAGNAIADDIDAVARHLASTHKDVAKGRTVVIGHSGGGWGTIALASRNSKGIRAYINISGGHGSQQGKPDGHCGHKPLVRGVKQFGAKSRQPMLWLYVENDTYIGPALARAMHKAFTQAGGKAELRILPAYGDEGHELFTADGSSIWAPVVSDWLSRLPAD